MMAESIGGRFRFRGWLKRGALSLLFPVGLLVAACSGGQSPVQVVRAFMTAIGTVDVSRAESLVCATQKGEVHSSLEPFGDVAQLGEAFDISFDDLSFQEKSNDGNVAVVRVRGTVTISFLGQQEKQDVDEEHVVVKEGGQWVICDP